MIECTQCECSTECTVAVGAFFKLFNNHTNQPVNVIILKLIVIGSNTMQKQKDTDCHIHNDSVISLRSASFCYSYLVINLLNSMIVINILLF